MKKSKLDPHPDRDMVRTDTRLAGEVRRYHTWPLITTQTVADHCYHCMRLWYIFWGALPPEVSGFFIWHDSGEIVTGDPPFPVKRDNPDLKAAFERVERQALRAMIEPHREVPSYILPTDMLTTEQKKKAKVCDLLDMFELGVHEYMLGNSYAWPIIQNTWQNVVKILYDMPTTISSPVYKYMARYSWLFEEEEDESAASSERVRGSAGGTAPFNS